MSRCEVHQCQCPHCQQETSHPDQELHRQMNLLLSRLDEQHRRWYVAVEATRIGVAFTTRFFGEGGEIAKTGSKKA